ncbi:hypothetical protein [Bradyrhizobium yuanmingense]|uniref:hypothetical protein n=1 Tax=Bradyrhizobium yuanmingense TaxID=108015 RepID=UPI003511E256
MPTIRVDDRSSVYSPEVDVSSATPAEFRPLTQLPAAGAKLKIFHGTWQTHYERLLGNPLTREAMQFAGKPASKSVTAQPLKVGKDAVCGFKEGAR